MSTERQQSESQNLTKSPSQASLVKKATDAGGALYQKASKTAKAVVATVTGAVTTAGSQTHRLFEHVTQGAGRAVTYVGDNPVLRKLTGALKLDWILNAAGRVDLQKAEAAVKKLQQEHPNESPSQIAHRIMVEKALYAGSWGLATSLVPGEAIALLAVDLATTTQIQAEMVYQIASAYGLDLKEPARNGEVLAIFGLALGGSRAVKVGLGLLRNVPVAGAVIGASSNAVMLYALGYAACRFYENKLYASTSQQTLTDLHKQSETYLEAASTQQAVMDLILVNMIVATHPEKSWQEILPQLADLNLSPNSLETIAANIKSPQPIDTLLAQLNRDYAVPLLAQCYRIARMDAIITPEEAKVMDKIAAKLDIDQNFIKQAVQSEPTPIQ